MRTLLLCLIMTAVGAEIAWSQEAPDNFVFVEGGILKDAPSNDGKERDIITDFIIGKFEVTQREWMDVMGENPSQFKGDDLPVEMVSWYDCVEYCNKRSRKEGLTPYYNIDKSTRDASNQTPIDDVKWIVTINSEASGYRLPTEAEWEYAARGGKLSKGLRYSGSDDIAKVAWYWQNSGDEELTGFWHWPTLEKNHNKTHPVGGKEPNELGLHDMSGNVREWCWDWHGGEDETAPSHAEGRVWRGGGWLGGDFCCEPSFRGSFEASGRGPDQGLRVCRGVET